jgi:hypothetical protein
VESGFIQVAREWRIPEIAEGQLAGSRSALSYLKRVVLGTIDRSDRIVTSAKAAKAYLNDLTILPVAAYDVNENNGHDRRLPE